MQEKIICPKLFLAQDAFSNPKTLALLALGGFLVGFGTRYAGGCTSGHAISGLSNLQLQSLIAIIGLFIGGLFNESLLIALSIMKRVLLYFAIGILFGITMIKSEAASWFRIYEMFQFKILSYVRNYWCCCCVRSDHYAIHLNALNYAPFLVKKFRFPVKQKLVKAPLFGGVIFGLGWALTGACPGPIYVLIGAGYFPLLIVLASALLGYILPTVY